MPKTWPDGATVDPTLLDSLSDNFDRNVLHKMALAVVAMIEARGASARGDEGIASLANGRVPDAQTGRGLAGGVAELNAQGKLPTGRIPPEAIPAAWEPGDIRWSGRAAVAAGWLLCDGAAVSRATHAALFRAIGTRYGAGDGSATFNLPDLRARVPLGYAAAAGLLSGRTARAVGSTGGEEEHRLTVAEMPAHDHLTHIGTGTGRAPVDPSNGPSIHATLRRSRHVSSTGGGGAHNNMPPFVTLWAEIRT